MPQKIVEVPGVGNVEFPDSMSDEQISAVIRKQVGAKAPTAPQQQSRSWLDSASDFAKGFWGNMTQAGQGLVDTAAAGYNSVVHPLDVAQGKKTGMGQVVLGIGASHDAVRRKAEESFKRGDYTEGVRHVLGYVIPMLGPQIDEMGNKAQAGKVAEALGEATSTGLQLAAPELLKGVKVPVSPKISNPNTAEAAAMQYLESEGVPVSAAAKTGNPYVKNIQKAADSTPLGAVVAGRAEKATTEGLRDLSGRLADRAHPSPVVPEQAGADVSGALQGRISDLNKTAGKNYSKFREIEADPANLENVQVRLDKEGKPVHQDVPLPVDMRPVKEAVRPIYERYKRSMPIAQQRASQGLRALENILGEDDFKPASIAEMDLGAIKEAARAEIPELRDMSQGLAAKAVTELDQAIRAKVAQAQRTLRPGETAPAESAPAAEAAMSGTVEGGPVVAGGPKTSIRVPGSDRTYSAHYEIRDLGDVQASHSGRTFQRNPNYAFENERDYTRQANQGKVVENATPAKFDPAYLLSDNPDATNGPMIIDRNGNVLGGNGRNMMLERVYQQNPRGSVAYRKLLELKAPQFGVDPAAVKGMKRPALFRVVDDVKHPAEAIADFNKKGTAELTQAERMVADSRRVSAGTLEDLAGRLEAGGPDATLAQVLDGKAGVDVLDSLIKDGAITPQERGALVSGEALTPAGRARINGMVLGRFFRDPAQLDQIPASIRAKLERMAAPLAKVEGKGDWSLAGPVSEALDLLERARAAGTENLTDYINQGGLFIQQQFSPEAITLARHLQATKPTELTKIVRQYAEDAGYAEGGGSLFGDTPTPAKSFSEAFGGESTLGTGAAPKPASAVVEMPKPKVVTGPAGTEALGSLKAGRAATAAKYDTAAVLKQLRDEPVQTFGQMTYAKDAGVDLLRKVAKEAPGEVRKIGRAWLEDLFGKAQSQGGFQHADTLWAKWRDLGPQTKKLIFQDPRLISDLDKFFLGAKKIAENPNPSGTAVVGISTTGTLALFGVGGVGYGAPIVLGAGALSKLLHSPRGVRLLTQGMKIPVRAPGAVLAAGQILKLAGDDVRPVDLPKAAENSRRSPTALPATILGR